MAKKPTKRPGVQVIIGRHGQVLRPIPGGKKPDEKT
jgi:hypothetical protein